MPAGLDPRLPVIVGVGQVNQRVDHGEPPLEPVDLMAEALRRAAADAGAPRALADADSVRVICELSWRYRDPGALVAERVGADPARPPTRSWAATTCRRSSTSPHATSKPAATTWCCSPAAKPWRTRTAAEARRKRARLDDTSPTASIPARLIGEDDSLGHPSELARGVVMPVQIYPMFDIALRAARRPEPRRAPAAHLDAVVAVLRGRRYQPERLDPRAVHARGDRRAVARQPHDRVSVHEAHELEQHGRAGRRAHHVLGRAGRGARRPARPLGVPALRRRRPRPLVRLEPGRPLVVARDPPRRPSRARAAPASASTTSPTSTCTRASRPPCRSAPASSGSGSTASSPSPAA